MNLIKAITALTLTLLMTGCATTNLDPTTELKNGYYSGNIGTQTNQGSFKIKAPQTLTSDYTPELLQLGRETGSRYTQINMKSTFPALNFFTVRVELNTQKNLAHTINLLLNNSREMKKISDRKTTINGHPATYLVFTSPGQEQISHSDNITNINITPPTTDGIYLVDYGKYNVIFWVTAGNSPYDTTPSKNAALQREIMNGTWGPEVAFVNSFKLYQ